MPVSDGDVVVPRELAPMLGWLARRGMRAAIRDDCARFPQALHDVVDKLDSPAALRARVAHGGHSVLHPVTMTVHGCSEELTPGQAAKVLGLTRQAVAGRLARGTLQGRRDDKGRWWIPASAVEVAGDADVDPGAV